MSPQLKNSFLEELCEIIELISPSMDDYLYVIDLENDFYYISHQAAERFALENNAFHNMIENFNKFVYPDDMPKLENDILMLMAGERVTHDMLYRWISKEGEPIWINCRGQVIKEMGKPMYMVGCINEVGTRQIADNNSGLLGEAGLKEFLGTEKAAQEGYLLRLGIDDLKGINARLGLEYGDMILRKTAECISECILPGQKLYRILGDEYMVLDFQGGSTQEAYELYRRIRQRVERFVTDNNYEVVFTLSGGLIEYSSIEDVSYANVMKFTEFALDEAKRQGRNSCYLFQQEDYEKFLKRRELVLRLRQAVNNNFEGFEVFYQPLFSVNHDMLYGAEALMRFQTEEMGMVSPAEFIPILEETGLIIPAGRWVLHQALKTCRDFKKYIPDFHMNINISNIQIMKSNIGGEILEAIKEYEILPSQLTIELTESGLLESDYRFTNIWSQLKSAGVQLALDDFGTGYSNFRYITELQPDIIKIDRIFTVKALENEFEYELLSLFSKMAHELKLKICIEGIESEEEKEIIFQLVPDFIQGYYFGRPCYYEQFEEQFLKEHDFEA